ncbi:MAG: hypothetical protein ACD_84C00032G0002 [uncultured bacterium]|nr:MAG: hypothetical protein ACD_84C00032G0002 [uncultured bacterium]
MSAKGRIRIYASGGCGVNVASTLEKYRGHQETAFAEIDVVYIDTSRSNLKAHIDHANCYLIEGVDGSGKLRTENHIEINDRVRAILQQFKPADLNIVISSAGGGSGSVIGPLLTRELITNELPTIVLTVGSADTRLDAENTLKTIKSYEAIAKAAGAPIVMGYLQNSPNMSRNEVDQVMSNTIISLAVLFSRENHELDTRDLFNWLRFDRVTTFGVQLASLTIVDSNRSVSGKDLGDIISIATLAKEGDVTSMGEMPEYQCVGFLPEGTTSPVVSKAPLQFIISNGIIPEAAKHLNGILSGLEQQQAARIRKSGVMTDKDRPSETGLIM